MLLATEVSNNLEIVDSILRKLFDKRLFYPKEADQIRLLKLKLWSERHKVSIEYILSKLIPYFEALTNKHSRRPRFGSGKGIGTTISNLTGPAAEAFLMKCIEKEFPDGEHKIAWREQTKQACIEKIIAEENELPEKRPRSILRFKSLVSFRQAYESRMIRLRKANEHLEKQISKQPWRGNPLR